MQSDLTTTNSGGTQSTTQSPQAANPGNLSTPGSNNLQANNQLNLFNSSNGVSLAPTPLSTVNLSSSTTATQSLTLPQSPKHHTNGIMLGFVGLLLVIAVVLFWQTFSFAKNTTDY